MEVGRGKPLPSPPLPFGKPAAGSLFTEQPDVI